MTANRHCCVLWIWAALILCSWPGQAAPAEFNEKSHKLPGGDSLSIGWPGEPGVFGNNFQIYPIVAGKGWHDISIGAPFSHIEAQLGPADEIIRCKQNGTDVLHTYSASFLKEMPSGGTRWGWSPGHIVVYFDRFTDKAIFIQFVNPDNFGPKLRGFSGETDRGVAIGSNWRRVIEAYGKPLESTVQSGPSLKSIAKSKLNAKSGNYYKLPAEDQRSMRAEGKLKYENIAFEWGVSHNDSICVFAPGTPDPRIEHEAFQSRSKEACLKRKIKQPEKSATVSTLPQAKPNPSDAIAPSVDIGERELLKKRLRGIGRPRTKLSN